MNKVASTHSLITGRNSGNEHSEEPMTKSLALRKFASSEFVREKALSSFTVYPKYATGLPASKTE